MGIAAIRTGHLGGILRTVGPAVLFACALAACSPRPGGFRPDTAITQIDELGITKRLDSAPPVERCDPFQLVSFNIKLPQEQERLQRLHREIQEDQLLAKADVWLLQEIETIGGEDAARFLADQFGGLNYAYAPSRTTSDGDTHGLAILSRFPLQDVRRLWLPRFNLVSNSRDRMALSATIDVCGRSIRIYNVHLDTRLNFGQRRDQLAPVTADAADHEPVVIAGDFNGNSFRWLGHLLPIPSSSQAKKLDRHMADGGYVNPFAGLGGTAAMGARLDAVYVRGLTTDKAAIGPWIADSDHRPLHVLMGTQKEPAASLPAQESLQAAGAATEAEAPSELEAEIEALIEAFSGESDERKPARLRLAEIGDPALPYLFEVLRHENWKYRWEAANTLGYMKHQSAAAPLAECIISEPNAHVRWRALWAVKVTDRKGVVAPGLFWSQVEGPDPRRRWNAVIGLSMYKDPRAVPTLHQGLVHKDREVRWEAVDALGRVHDDRSSSLMEDLVFSEENSSVRREATGSLGEICDPTAVELLTRALAVEHPQVRWRAAVGLGRCGATDRIGAIEKRLDVEQDPLVIENLEKSLTRLKADPGRGRRR